MRLFLALLTLAVLPLHAADWPEWRGEGRSGVWTEQGVLESFPDEGLSVSWRVPTGEGYAGPAVAKGRVFLTDFLRESGIRGKERARALDERTGETLWTHEWNADYGGTEPKWANGPRATPTVDGDRVYVVGGMGRLLCLEAASGKVMWERDYVADFGATVPTWGVSSPPLVHGKRLIALVGGEKNAMVVAFDTKTGEEVWRALPGTGEAGYAAPILIEAGGVEQVVVWTPRAVSGLDPQSGELHWRQPFESKMGLSVATPVFDGRRLFVSSFFNGSMMLELGTDEPSATKRWQRQGKSEQPADTESLHALITTPVLDGEMVYGVGSYGELRGLRAGSGDRVWESLGLVVEQARWAAALIVRHGDRYFINNDRGELVIARFTPEGYREIDRTPLIEPTTSGGGRRKLGGVLWSHPAYANRHVVVRNDREIVRASLAASADPE